MGTVAKGSLHGNGSPRIKGLKGVTEAGPVLDDDCSVHGWCSCCHSHQVSRTDRSMSSARSSQLVAIARACLECPITVAVKVCTGASGLGRVRVDDMAFDEMIENSLVW